MTATKFSFTLDSFSISETRSKHEDTDFVSFTVSVQPEVGIPFQNTIKKSMGNVNNGTHPVILTLPVTVNPGDVVYMSYLIVNAGHSSPGTIVAALEGASTKLATAAGAAIAGAIGGSAIPLLGTALGAAAGFIAGEINTILTANCDGSVAAEVQRFTYDLLIADTSAGSFRWETHHPGTNSATGCGSNSSYSTAWHIDAGEYKPWNSKGGHSITNPGGANPNHPNPPHEQK